MLKKELFCESIIWLFSFLKNVFKTISAWQFGRQLPQKNNVLGKCLRDGYCLKRFFNVNIISTENMLNTLFAVTRATESLLTNVVFANLNFFNGTVKTQELPCCFYKMEIIQTNNKSANKKKNSHQNRPVARFWGFKGQKYIYREARFLFLLYF